MRGNHLVRLRESTGPNALVLIHPASGSAASYRALEPHLGGDFSVYAFQATGVDAGRPRSIEGIAQAYLAEFQAAAPDATPIYVGWSFSGPVVVEMARLGEEQGRGPAGVILLDSAPPEALRGRTADHAAEIGGLLGLDLSATDARSVDELLDEAAELIAVASDTPGLTGADLRPFWDVYVWHQGIFDDGWQARPCAAPLLMVRAQDETGWNAEPECLGWSALVGRAVPVVRAPGTHYTLMDEHRLPGIARIVDRAIEEWAAAPHPARERVVRPSPVSS
ncbi:thioesterase domain-containing protein [Streptomyces echinatus]|uniref:Thioesterase domain-containing protein n=1 Tax=Streptomyces echinatus TaxID=67293 RepID=A0A7W9Q2E4_9ACTN|nr:thioesterase domain-containing protein [Streptomyces echinatus]MBB5931477.1 thioesterase domain-containing protein [Streptomyces echinatus]